MFAQISLLNKKAVSLKCIYVLFLNFHSLKKASHMYLSFVSFFLTFICLIFFRDYKRNLLKRYTTFTNYVESVRWYHYSIRVKFALKARSLCKRVSPCLTRSKCILLRAFSRIPIQSRRTSNWQEDGSREKEDNAIEIPGWNSN